MALNMPTGFRPTGGLGGALQGHNYNMQVQEHDQTTVMRQLAQQMQELQLQEAQKDVPVNDLVRQNRSALEGHLSNAWAMGEMGETLDMERKAKRSKAQEGIDQGQLAKLKGRAEFYSMADQYMEAAGPAGHAGGEGWKEIQASGKALGLEVPDQPTPEFRAHAKRAAMVAVKTIPHLQRQIEQQTVGEYALQREGLQQAGLTQRNADDNNQRQREAELRAGTARDVARMGADSRLAAAQAGAAGRDAKRRPITPDNVIGSIMEKMRLGQEPLNEVEIAMLEMHVRGKAGAQLDKTVGAKLNQLKAAAEGGDDAAQVQLQADLAQRIGPLLGQLERARQGEQPDELASIPANERPIANKLIPLKFDFQIEKDGSVRLSKTEAEARKQYDQLPPGTLYYRPGETKPRRKQ